ncbi:MAG: hypothetical protein IH600_09255 [Bacteroidetes bacterium]|nr:hypothetical protein [Bacteroidota bacterium]
MRLVGVVSIVVGFLLFPAVVMAGVHGNGPHTDRVALPVRFVENAGQWPSAIRATALQQGFVAVFGTDGFSLRGVGTSFGATEIPSGGNQPSRYGTFVEAAAGNTFALLQRRREVCRYYSARDGEVQERAAKTFDEAWYENVWPGISSGFLVRDGALIQEFRIAPGADLRRLRMRDGSGIYDHIRVSGWMRGAGDVAGRTVRVILQRDGDVVSFTAAPRPTADTITIALVLGTYLGGSANEELADMDVLRDGSVVLSGETESFDFPLANPIDGQHSPMGSDLFITRFDAESMDIVFSTFYKGALARPRSPSSRQAVTTEGIGHGTVHLAKANYLIHIGRVPITPDARWKTPSNWNLFRLDAEGRLLTSTFIPDTLLTLFIDMDSDIAGNVYLLFSIESLTPPMVTSNALMPHAHENEIHGMSMMDGFIMKFPPTIDSILYATCIGGTGQDDYKDLAVDPAGNMYVVGEQIPVYDCAHNLESRDYPCVNPLRMWPSEVEGIVTRISCDGGSIDYSTYLGGADRERIYAADVDANGFLHITGYTASGDFPRTATIPGFADAYTASFVAGLTPSGALSYAVPVSTSDPLPAITADDCGHVSILGVGTAPEKHPLRRLPKPAFWLATIDVTAPALLFGTAWIPSYILRHPNCVAAPGALYLCESAFPDANTLLLERPLAGNYNSLTGAFTMLDVPFGTSNTDLDLSDAGLELRFDLPAEVQVYADSGLTLNGTFPLRIDVKNKSGAAPLRVDVQAGTGLRSLSGARDTVFTSPVIAAGSTQRFTWPLTVVQQARSSARYTVRATAVSGCQTITRIQTATVVDAPGAFYQLECAIESPSLGTDETGRLLEPNPSVLRATIRNRAGDKTLENASCEVVLPVGMGLSFVPAGDGLRGPFTLAPGASIENMWTIDIGERNIPREAGLLLLVRDHFGNVIKECRAEFPIPAVTALACGNAEYPDLLFPPDTVPALPLPVEFRFGIENSSDSMILAENIQLDLSGAPHLALAEGEIASRGTLPVPYRVPLGLRWQLELISLPVGREVDTVVVMFDRKRTGTPVRCAFPIPIGERPEDLPSLACLLTRRAREGGSVDTIVSPTMPVEMHLLVENVGKASALDAEARLDWTPPSAFASQQPQQQTIGSIDAGGQRDVSWLLQPLRPATDTSVVITAMVSEAGAGAATVCSDTLLLRAPAHIIVCALAGPDSVCYQVHPDSSGTDSVTLSLTLLNQTDVVLADLTVIYDATPGGGIEAPGGGMPLTIPTLAPADSLTLTHTLRFDRLERDCERQSIGITVLRSGTDTVSQCGTEILFQGTRLLREVACQTIGHDSIWLDPDGERFMPDPLQVAYAVKNTGDLAVRDCEVAIHLPPDLRLEQPGDSVQRTGEIPPGETALLSWLLRWTPPAQPVAVEHVTFSVGMEGQDFTAAPCDFEIHILDGPSPSVVVTPWLFFFEAERYAAPPPSQSVHFDVPGVLATGWSVLPDAPWLLLAPPHGLLSTDAEVSVTTTDLPEGLYQAGIIVTADGPVSPARLIVQYRIRDLTGTGSNPAAPSAITVYPHPVRGGEDLLIDLPDGSIHLTQIRLVDMLGRQWRAVDKPEQTATHVSMSTVGLPRGAYLLVLLGPERREVVRVLVF